METTQYPNFVFFMSELKFQATLLLHYIKPVAWNRGYAVAQLVEALRYKPEGRGFDSADPSGPAI